MISAALRRKRNTRFKKQLGKRLTDSRCVVFRGMPVKFMWEEGVWIVSSDRPKKFAITHGKNMSIALYMIREAVNLVLMPS